LKKSENPSEALIVCMHRQISLLKDCTPITAPEVQRLCLKAREILIEEANVQVVDGPVTVSVYFR
jgi:serine/threonine-protein phosphatase 4 catalytic subunit